MNLYEGLLAKADETNQEVNKLREAGEYSCSVFLQNGFIEACEVIRKSSELNNLQLDNIKEALQKR